MRVIAIKDSVFTGEASGKALHKGSIYHVINKVFYPYPMVIDDLGNYPNGFWLYELLELIGFHHEDYFLELPDDDIMVEEEIKIKINNL